MPDINSLTSTRCQRTHERTIHGELPPPKGAKLWVGNGTGMSSCNGCEEEIANDEREYELVFSEAVALFFHTECFSTWTDVTAVKRV
jgi:hypothetical protein